MSEQAENCGMADRVFIEIRPAGAPEAPPPPEVPADLPALNAPLQSTVPTAGPVLDEIGGAIREVKISYNPDPHSRRVVIATPSTGVVRIEWFHAQMFLTKPVNWFSILMSPVNQQVAEARNDCVIGALQDRADWILFIDHDVIPPPDAIMRMQQHMIRLNCPVVSGLYYTRCNYPEPLIFRGRCNGPFYDWEPGEKVWCDGIPMGLVLIHTSLFRAMRPPWFTTPNIPVDVEIPGSMAKSGTEDLFWCDRVLNEGIIEKAGWKVPDPNNPFLLDTSIMCQHIDPNGRKFPECTGTGYLDDHRQAREAIRRLTAEKAAV